MIIVLDTSIIVAFLLSSSKNSSLRLLLRLAQSKKITFAICKESLLELKQTVSYPKFKESPRYNNQLVAKFINQYQHQSKKYILKNIYQGSSRDPSDNIFLNLAMTCHADYLLSGDKDLLVLKQIEKTVICTPKAFIQTVI